MQVILTVVKRCTVVLGFDGFQTIHIRLTVYQMVENFCLILQNCYVILALQTSDGAIEVSDGTILLLVPDGVAAVHAILALHVINECANMVTNIKQI